jgi:hypothetical protein
MINAPSVPYPSFGSHEFAGGFPLAEPVKAFETKIFVNSGFSPAPLAPAGIGETVNQMVLRGSADLSPSLRQRIAELSRLKPNWDGENAKVVKLHVLADVIETLKRFARRMNGFREPFLAPTFDGLVQMEWHDEKRSLEIEAVDEGWSLAAAMIGNNGQRLYFTAGCERSDFQRLEKFYEWFLGNELIGPSL